MKDMKVVTDHAPHGHGKGGMSQNRYQRIADEQMHAYLVRCAEAVTEYFSTHPVDAILVGGPGMIKNDLIDKYLDAGIKKKIIYVADTSNGGRDGIRDILQKAKEDKVLENMEYMKERKLVEKFIDNVSRDGLAEYGENEVRVAIEEGRVEHLIISEKLKPDIVEDLSERAFGTGAKVTVVSTSTEEGAMFAGGFTGIGAFLRWKKM